MLLRNMHRIVFALKEKIEMSIYRWICRIWSKHGSA